MRGNHPDLLRLWRAPRSSPRARPSLMEPPPPGRIAHAFPGGADFADDEWISTGRHRRRTRRAVVRGSTPRRTGAGLRACPGGDRRTPLESAAGRKQCSFFPMSHPTDGATSARSAGRRPGSSSASPGWRAQSPLSLRPRPVSREEDLFLPARHPVPSARGSNRTVRRCHRRRSFREVHRQRCLRLRRPLLLPAALGTPGLTGIPR